MGLQNLKLMIPFCRTVEEGKRVLSEMEKHGLRRGDKGLEVYVMCEIPSNVILADEFAEIFDGFRSDRTTSHSLCLESTAILKSWRTCSMNAIQR